MKRRASKPFLAVVSILFLILASFVYVFYMGGLEVFVNRQIASLLGDHLPLKVRIGEVKGNLISGVILSDVTIRYSDSSYNYMIASFSTIAVDYSINNLWNRKYQFDYLFIDSAVVSILRDSTGKLILPIMSKTEKKTSIPDISAKDVQISRSSLELRNISDTLQLSRISFTGAVTSEQGLVSAIIYQLGFDSNRDELALGRLSGKITYSQSSITFQDITVTALGSDAKLSGSYSPETKLGRAELVVDDIDVSRIGHVIGKNISGLVDVSGTVSIDNGRLDGAVSIAGDFMHQNFKQMYVEFGLDSGLLTFDTLYGTALGNCSIDGAGSIDFGIKPEIYELSAFVRDFDLKEIVKNSFHSDLNGEILLSGSSFRKEDFKLIVKSDLFESTFHDYPLHRSRGVITVTRDSMRFEDGFEIYYFENKFQVAGAIAYNGDMNLEVLADIPNLERYKQKLFISEPFGRATVVAELTGKTADPDLSGYLTSDSLWLYGMFAGKATVDFDIDRFLNGRQGSVKARFREGSLWNLPYDSAEVVIRLDSTVAYIESSRVLSESVVYSSQGSLDYGSEPSHLIMDSLQLNLLGHSFVNRDAIRIDIDSVGFLFRQADLGDETALLQAEGRVNYDETIEGELHVRNVLIKPWLELFGRDAEIDGYLSSDFRVDGSFVQPEIIVSAEVDSLSFRDLYLGDLLYAGSYDNQRLLVDSLRIISEEGKYRIEGSLPMDLAFVTDGRERLLDRPIDLTLKAHDRRFDLVTMFLPSVENLEGELVADIHLNGTTEKPHLEGITFIRNAELKYYDLADTLFSDSVGAVMIDNKIVIDGIIAYVKDFKNRSRLRYANISGEIEVVSIDTLKYGLQIEFPKRFPFRYDLEDISGVIEGDIQVIGVTPPVVTGDIEIISFMYRANFASAEEGSPIMAALSGENTWDLDINFDITSNYWIKNDNIDAELGGFINLIREKGKYRFIGEMEILRGSSYFFEKSFRLEPYSKVSFEDIEYPNPRLDIIAHTRVPGVRFAEEDRPSMTDLSIHVTGTLEKPDFNTVAGDTTFTREDILPLIVANTYSGQSGGTNGQFEQRVTDIVSSQIARIGSRQLSLIGVETFEIDAGYGAVHDLSTTRVTLGRYIGPNLYVFGRSAISGQSGQALGFEWRFNRSLRLEGRKDEEELYHLNMNLHWEF